jgi:hypothetical protein
MPRENGASSTPRPLQFTTLALEYWIARFRGDDGCRYDASRLNQFRQIQFSTSQAEFRHDSAIPQHGAPELYMKPSPHNFEGLVVGQSSPTQA